MSNLDTTFLIALGGAILGAASMVLHVVAPRTKNTIDDALRDDVDEVLAFMRGAKSPSTASDGVAKKVAGAITKAVSAIAIVIMLALGTVSTLAACTAAQRASVEKAVWDCTAPERAEAVKVLTPVVESVIVGAASADGSKFDTSTIKSAISKANLLSEAGTLLVCATANAFAALSSTSTSTSTVSATTSSTASALSTPSAALPLDPIGLHHAFDEIRAAQFPGATFLTPNGEI